MVEQRPRQAARIAAQPYDPGVITCSPGKAKKGKKRPQGESVMRLERQFYALASVVRWDGWHG